MFCPHCGKELKDDAQFCGGCGKPVKAEAPPATQVPQVEPGGVAPGPPPPGVPPVTPGRGASKKTLTWIIVAVVAVAVIIAVMGTVAGIMTYSSNKNKADRRTCQANQRTIEGAIQMYRAENDDKLPKSVEDLVPYYLKKVPQCPSGSKPYELEKTGEGEKAVCPNDPTHKI